MYQSKPIKNVAFMVDLGVMINEDYCSFKDYYIGF
ncbi:hypothetical protein WH7805_08321 [Synechococcus sp. WH 7805]|nr:hypothetical protein WH7805_08321 [Synechococcus sp. WH 7805]